MAKTEDWTVTEADSGTTLLTFVHEQTGKGISKKALKRAIDQNACLVNGRVERFASIPIGVGDVVQFTYRASVPKTIAILYEDDALVIYNKPAGMTTEALAEQQLGILVHRLDRDTTGAILFAKDQEMAEQIKELFKTRKIKKTYWALVDGVPTEPSGTLDNYLGVWGKREGMALRGEVTPEKGKRAITHWKLKKAGEATALLECSPLTGRTHQIRLHMSGMGHPILGDYIYGRLFKSGYLPPRHLLHARALAFPHPITGKPVEIVVPRIPMMTFRMSRLSQKINTDNFESTT